MTDIAPRFDNSYARLPERLYARQMPEPVPQPELIVVNDALARQLGVEADWLRSADGLAMLSGNRMPAGAEPIAAVYAGHQFGSWNPQLGDGRAVLLGELVSSGGLRFDLQLKGSGRTPFSRGGDGRSPLGPVLREYLVSEAMAALGVPTTRSLAAVTTGAGVMRETLLPGGVLARVAQSHIRIGTFQYFGARRDYPAVQCLVDYVVARHYPELAGSDNTVLALLEKVIDRQADLIAWWQSLGFIHGVMNTDNMLVTGETIDYGPCAFVDGYHPDTVFSSIDHGGRYAYRNQPTMAHWNLVRLAEALLPLLDDDREVAIGLAEQALDGFPERFARRYRKRMCRKLGIDVAEEQDEHLVARLMTLMAQEGADFTLTFRSLADSIDTAASAGRDVSSWYRLPASFDSWLSSWQARLQREPLAAAERQARMYQLNPLVIPRNHRVEEVIGAATDNGDFGPFHRLLEALTEPCVFDARYAHYAAPPKPEQAVQRTFCGT